MKPTPSSRVKGIVGHRRLTPLELGRYLQARARPLPPRPSGPAVLRDRR